MRIGAVWINVRPVADVVRWNRDQDRHEFHPLALTGSVALKPGQETHVEIPLVADPERFDAACDGMVGQGSELRLPDRVAGEHVFVMPADPTLHLVSGLIGQHLDAVVHESDACPFLGPGLDLRQSAALVLHDLMSPATVHEEHDRIGLIENRLVLGPTVEHKLNVDVGDILQAFGQQLHAGIEFMHAGRVRRLSRDQDDLSCLGDGRNRDEHRADQQDKREHSIQG